MLRPDTEREYTDGSGMVHLYAVWDRGGSAGKGLRPLMSDRDGYQRAAVTLAADILRTWRTMTTRPARWPGEPAK